LAGCLAAGADGLERELELPPMVTGDPHVDASLVRLPTSLGDAIPAFEESRFAREFYGDVFLDVYPVMLRHELELFARQVSDWERERYREVM
jgi:glutamine synthetase